MKEKEETKDQDDTKEEKDETMEDETIEKENGTGGRPRRMGETEVSNTGVILFSFYPNTLTMHHAYPRFHFYYHTKQWDGYGKREERGTLGIRRAPKLPFAVIRKRRIVEMEEDRGE